MRTAIFITLIALTLPLIAACDVDTSDDTNDLLPEPEEAVEPKPVGNDI